MKKYIKGKYFSKTGIIMQIICVNESNKFLKINLNITILKIMFYKDNSGKCMSHLLYV